MSKYTKFKLDFKGMEKKLKIEGPASPWIRFSIGFLVVCIGLSLFARAVAPTGFF